MSELEAEIPQEVTSQDIRDYEDMVNADEEKSRESDESLISVEDEEGIDVWGLVSSSAINLVLPFINGMMLGFGEILAHEIGFKYGWYGAKVEPRTRMIRANSVSRDDTEKSKWI